MTGGTQGRRLNIYDHEPVAARISITVLVVLLASGVDLAAQDRGRLHGIVVDSAARPIADVDVSVAAARQLTRTDSAGAFLFVRLPADSVSILVRRIGFQPQRVVAMPGEATPPLRVVLVRDPTMLEGVEVNARLARKRSGIEDFYRRRARGVGTYFTRDDFVERHSQRASDLLREVPGLRFVRIPGGMGIRFNSSAIVRRDCTPMIWLDGQRAPGLEIDDVPASDIEGLELYNGPSTTPVQFSQYSSASTCGTVVIWTRIPGT
jgi:hypothetical protein